ETLALSLALDWAIDPKQTAKGLRDALASYRALPGPIPAAEVFKAEARYTEWALDRPGELRDRLTASMSGSVELTSHPLGAWSAALVDVMPPPWGRERARRVFRRLFTALVRDAAVDPSRRLSGPGGGLVWAALLGRVAPGVWPVVGIPVSPELASEVA